MEKITIRSDRNSDYTFTYKGEEVVLDNVLLVNDGTLKVGTPLVEGAKVKVKVLSQFKGEKLLVFKRRRRKGYTNRQGHRQNLTKIQVIEF